MSRKERYTFDREEEAKCMRGELYDADFAGRYEMVADAMDLCRRYNAMPARDVKARQDAIREIFGSVGENPTVEPNLFVGFGFNVTVGDNFYANNNCNFMDPGKITFGDNVFVGPDCGFYTAHHPVGWKMRNEHYERALPITVGDNVWFGGGCRVLPGVTIGSNVVIGAGSVVTHDVPDNCVAAGNPCRVLRSLDPEGNDV